MADETKASRKSLPPRTPPPGQGGLASEARPGIGARGPGPKPKRSKTLSTPHDHEPLGRDAPLIPREPQEQAPDSRAHELERDTGVSGHSGGT